MTSDQWLMVASIVVPLMVMLGASHVTTSNRLVRLEERVARLRQDATKDARLDLLRHCGHEQQACPARREYITGVFTIPPEQR